ncbi:hypothetical protein FCT18_12335 [Lysinibacillus sphaericus]|nr:hypothetical protein [Lysinibacillus sphaericus]MED4546379.1 hypothetical protein [Lysinibacillus sphaericus]TKI18840.1 hypothetical protein FCT18_12335 [Lysinibacillus sphaericus]GEC83783.1 hypothetical protein LSP03_35260 [Lysinibacillus sphaericus]
MKNCLVSSRFLLLTLLLFTSATSLLYILDSVSYTNMINNGYISKNAVEFIIKTEEPSLDIDLEEPYLLMQYKLDNPQLKYIYIHPSVKLPPINYQKQPRSTDYIITGNVFPEEVLSRNMKSLVIGQFDTPSSYLNREAWYIVMSQQINLKNGTKFILNVESGNPHQLIEKILPNTSYQLLENEDRGTAILTSNILLKGFLIISLLFVIIAQAVSVVYAIQSKKSIVQILYFAGGKWQLIFLKVFKIEFIALIMIMLLAFLSLIAFNHFYSIWGNQWYYVSVFYILVTFIVYFLACLLMTKSLIKKGVRSF